MPGRVAIDEARQILRMDLAAPPDRRALLQRADGALVTPEAIFEETALLARVEARQQRAERRLDIADDAELHRVAAADNRFSCWDRGRQTSEPPADAGT